MTHTFHKNFYHLVWSTKEREPLIINEHKERVFEYLGGSLKTQNCIPIQIGGMNDHVHILTEIPPNKNVSDIIKDVKVASNKWINSLLRNKNFSWQEGYGSFSVSSSQIEGLIKYIVNQEEHHKKRSFNDEFIELLKKHGIKFDEKYLWK